MNAVSSCAPPGYPKRVDPAGCSRGMCEPPPASQLKLTGSLPPRRGSQVRRDRRRADVVASTDRLRAEVLSASHFHELHWSRCPLQACLERCR